MDDADNGDAPMYDNPAPIVYERAGAADGEDGVQDDDDGLAAHPAAASLAALRRSAAAFEAPGAWEAAFDPVAAGVVAGETPPPKAAQKAAASAAAPPPHRRRRNSTRQPIDAAEVFSLVRDIRDPEHPYTLEQLGVVSRPAVLADDARGIARVDVTPTVDHCSMATLIGLCVRARLDAALPPRFKVRVRLAPGSHATEEAVNRQLADKERVAAAMENARLRAEVERCLAPPAG